MYGPSDCRDGSGGTNKLDPGMVVSVYKRGAIPMITWEPWSPKRKPHTIAKPSIAPAYRLSSITRGKYDPYIRSFARGVKSVRGPVMIRPMHEMNGTWYPWGGTVNGNKPADFVGAWRHIHDIFVSEGATNATWVWSVNWASLPQTPENQFTQYYPGDAYVDWVGSSGFNWGTSIPSNNPWRTFDELYTPSLSYLKTVGKPVIISEIATVEQGGSKPAWLADTYSRIQTEHPEVKAVVYYDAKDVSHGAKQDWRIASSAASQKAFRQATAPAYFIAGPAAPLSSWRRTLSPADWAKLTAFKRIY